MQAARGLLIRVVKKIPLAVGTSTITENAAVLVLYIPPAFGHFPTAPLEAL